MLTVIRNKRHDCHSTKASIHESEMEILRWIPLFEKQFHSDNWYPNRIRIAQSEKKQYGSISEQRSKLLKHASEQIECHQGQKSNSDEVGWGVVPGAARELTWGHPSLPSGTGLCVGRSVVSDSSRPHGLWLTRLHCPWDSPGKNPGVGGHGLLQGSSRPGTEHRSPVLRADSSLLDHREALRYG